jgi:hypothetical protein
VTFGAGEGTISACALVAAKTAKPTSDALEFQLSLHMIISFLLSFSPCRRFRAFLLISAWKGSTIFVGRRDQLSSFFDRHLGYDGNERICLREFAYINLMGSQDDVG